MDCPSSLPQDWRQSKKASASFYHVQQKVFGTRKFERRANQEEKSVVGKWIPVINRRLTVFIWHSAITLYIQKKDNSESTVAGEHATYHRPTVIIVMTDVTLLLGHYASLF